MLSTKNFNSISAFFKSINLKIEQDLDFTIHPMSGLHGKPPMSSPFFRTNYYTFLLIESGKGHYTIDGKWFPLKAFSFYFTNPGHLKSFSIEEEISGFMITFSEEFLKTNYPGKIETDFSFLFDETIPVMYLPEETFYDLKTHFELTLKEYIGKSPFKEKILANQLVNILFRTKELLISCRAKIESANRPAEISQQFKSLLNRNFLSIFQKKENKILNVQDYADYLHLHPNYFSTLVKEETGKTVKLWIDEKIISEAKSLLKNSTLSVSEVAYELTFDDPANFSRFFKGKTGLTPAQFRKS